MHFTSIDFNMAQKIKTLCCKKCKSTDLSFQAWVDEFNNFIDHGDYVWCRSCEQITQDEQIPASASRSVDSKAFGRHASAQASERSSAQALDK